MSDKLKHIRVREAKSRDIGLFRKLWTKLLGQQFKEVSIVSVNKKTIDFYEELFNFYVGGEYEGIILFVADKAVLMWGDNASRLDYTGKLITNWGYYSESNLKEDIQKALWNYAEKWAKEHKFSGILTDIPKESKISEDFELISSLAYKAL